MKSRKLKSKWYQGILLVAAMAFAAAPPAAHSQAIHGSGTINHVPLWTGSSKIGNSALSQSGGNLTTSGSITAASFSGDGSVLSNVNAAKLGGILFSGFAQLSAASNTFSGSISANAVNSTNAYQIGGENVLSVPNTSIYVGQSIGASDTGAGGNAAIGQQALFSNTTGSNNAAIGYAALYSNTTGNYNTASGDSALYNNGTGRYNTASGYEALAANPTGSHNIAIGYLAGDTFIGGESNNIDIGNPGVAGDSGVIRIGTANAQTTTFVSGITGVTTGSTTASAVLIDSNGQLGTLPSSRRYKEDIHDMGAASDGLLRLRPVTFRYKKPYDDGSKPIQYGLVAEEVAEVYPDLVVRGKDGQMETVQYYKLDAMLLNELQKLAKAHAADQADLAQLQLQIAELRRQGEEQQAAIRQLLSLGRSAAEHRPWSDGTRIVASESTH